MALPMPTGLPALCSMAIALGAMNVTASSAAMASTMSRGTSASTELANAKLRTTSPPAWRTSASTLEISLVRMSTSTMPLESTATSTSSRGTPGAMSTPFAMRPA